MITLAILAGGKGTRLSSIQSNLQKCLTLIDGKPIIHHQLQLARRHGIEKFIILTSHYSDQIINFINNSEFRNQTIIINEEQPLGTSGSFRNIEELWKDTILVLYGDVLCNFNIERFVKYHNKKNGLGTLLVHPNDHPFDSDLIELDENQLITSIHKKPHLKEIYRMNLSNACAYLLEPELIRYIPSGPSDWVHDVFPRVLINSAHLYGYRSSEYLKDMGTPERLEQVRNDFESGKVMQATYEKSRGAIFIDRDGTINKEVDRCHREEDFELLPGVASAIKKINKSEYIAVIITNQPVIACGFCSFDSLRKIHCKMDSLLSNEKAYIDALYFCPHHPDKGYPGENVKYKIECKCRKPQIGLFEQAIYEHNIDVSKSVFIGDSTRDIEAGKRLGVQTILVKTGYAGKDNKFEVQPDYEANNLKEAVDLFLMEI